VNFGFFAVVAPLVWLIAWIAGSIIYRRTTHKPLFPRAPDGALFVEAWRSGRSLKNLLTRIGGARNCLLVYVADGALTIVPVFPFNLMFLPEIYGLEATAPVGSVRVSETNGLLGRRLLLSIDDGKEQRFEISLRNQHAFQEALEGKLAAAPAREVLPARRRGGWRLNFFRVFALVWGVGAAAAGFAGLKDDIRFRSEGAVTAGKIVGHSGEIGARNDMGIIKYIVQGRTYTLTSLRGPGIYKIGDTEQVRYMPADPASAREDDYLGFDLLFAILGSCMLILGLTVGRIASAFRRSMNV
jgi:hypothetical protein